MTAAAFQVIRPSCSARSNMRCCRRSVTRRNQKDFGDDYVAFANAKLAYEIDARQVSREVRRDFATTIKQEQDRVAGQVAEHKERVQRLRSRVKDFDEVMSRATLPVAPHVERLLLASKKSDRLTYVLGKNQAKLAQLNRMSPEEAAREIGRLEGRLSLPSATKTKTQARKPITPLKGSGACAAVRDCGRQRLHQEDVRRPRVISARAATGAA